MRAPQPRPSQLRRERAAWWGRDRGSEPVEFAIVASAMIVVTFVVIQVGLVYFARSIALGAATQGVTAGRAYGALPGAGENRAWDFLEQAGDGLTGQGVDVNQTAGEIEITVSGFAISVVPGITFEVSQSAHGSIEQPS